MRIRYAKIVNSIGLTDGLGKDTVEVSFDTNQKIIMLLGVNGSGKSSLLRQLNPAFQNCYSVYYLSLLSI